MPRLPRICPIGIAQHVIQRGNNRQSCFAAWQDYAFYIHCLGEAALKFGVDIHAWVLMTNHVHLLLTPQIKNGISLLMQDIGRKYVLYFNRTYNRSGTLWEGRFKSCLVDPDNYLLTCYRYIELNPVRAKMVADPAAYYWSSYQCNGLGKKSDMITYHQNYLTLGDNNRDRQKRYRGLFESAVEEKSLTDIRQATQQNLALGSEKFKAQIETLCQRRVTPKRAGRPKQLKAES